MANGVGEVLVFQKGFRQNSALLQPGDIFQKADASLWKVLPDGSYEQLGSGGGSQPLSMLSVPISSAELLALDTVPKELLPAPDGRNYYVVHGVVLHYRFGTLAYTGDFFPGFGYGDDTVALAPNDGLGSLFGDANGSIVHAVSGSPLSSAGFLAQTADAYLITVNGSAYLPKQWVAWMADQIEDKPFSIANYPGSPLADGDGTLTVRVFYTTIDGAP